MKIWADGDSLSAPVSRWLLEQYQKRKIPLTILCDTAHYPKNAGPVYRCIAEGQEAVDNTIINEMKAGDLVITRDFRLAAKVLDKEGITINDRGLKFTAEYLKMRQRESDIALALRAGNSIPKRKKKGISKEEFNHFCSEFSNYCKKGENVP